MSSSRLIAKEALSAFERWELPNVEQATGPRPRDSAPPGGDDDTLQGPLTAEQLEAIQKAAYDEAWQQGYDEGLAQGHKEGHQSGQKEVHAEVQRLRQIASALAEPLQEVDARVEEELVTLALTLARQLLRRELQADPGHIVPIVREALRILPASASRVRLYLHPDDARIVQETLSTEGTDEAESWRIVEDPALTRGGCRIESEHSRIDATLEKRLADLVAELLGEGRQDGQSGT